jgi:dihydrofolate synthase/folylpolyglutamate synthase
MNQQQILDELANLNPPQTEFNANAIKKALQLCDEPQHKYKVIHIAGTNGKGSTAAFLEAGLLAAGYRVGKYTSPYIHCLNECILLNQQQISDADLANLYLELKELLKPSSIVLSSFEMLTLIMFVYFARCGIDYLVLETGLGGLDDATNVVDSEYSVITNIALEHTQWLGNSLTDIARHKAGIIHNGKVVIADTTPELIAAVSARTNNYVNVLEKYNYHSDLDVSRFITRLWFTSKGNDSKYVGLGLFGHFQARNFLAAYEVLQDIGISDTMILAAAKTVKWSGRLQLLSRYPQIIADASHNADGCKVLVQSLESFINPADCAVIASALRDKDRDKMLGLYAQPRATPARELAKLAYGKFEQIHVYNAPLTALAAAKRMKKKFIIISGSIYLLKYFVK